METNSKKWVEVNILSPNLEYLYPLTIEKNENHNEVKFYLYLYLYNLNYLGLRIEEGYVIQELLSTKTVKFYIITSVKKRALWCEVYVEENKEINPKQIKRKLNLYYYHHKWIMMKIYTPNTLRY